MAELLCSRFVQTETLVVRKKDRSSKQNIGYNVKDTSDNCYLLTRKLPLLEMVFREGERDFIFNMIDAACSYYGKNTISNEDATDYALKIASGEIKVTILPDGSYTLK